MIFCEDHKFFQPIKLETRITTQTPTQWQHVQQEVNKLVLTELIFLDVVLVDDDRYNLDTIQQCYDKCYNDLECKSFTFASLDQDPNHLDRTVCTIYNTDTYTGGTWGDFKYYANWSHNQQQQLIQQIIQ